MPPKFNVNSRTITAPLAAFTMAALLFVYARTSIQAAKRNAQKHREADGGQISWRNESLRRHGVLEPPEEQGVVSQLILQGKERLGREVESEKEKERATREEKLVRERSGGRG